VVQVLEQVGQRRIGIAALQVVGGREQPLGCRLALPAGQGAELIEPLPQVG